MAKKIKKKQKVKARRPSATKVGGKNKVSKRCDIPAQPDSLDDEIGTEIARFVSAIEGLAQSLPLVMHVVDTANSRNLNQLNKFVEKHSEGKQVQDGETVYKMPFDCVFELKKQVRNLKGLNLAYQIIPNSFIVSLVSQYDGFLSSILRLLFVRKPEILNASEKQIVYSKIIEFGSIDAIKDYFIEKDIDTLLRKNHIDQLKSISNIFNITIAPREDLKKCFLEVTERRNLFVHCNGVVSSQYVNICKMNSILHDDIKIGSTLNVDPEYFYSAYKCIFEIGTTIGQVLWRKIIPEQIGKADQNLVEMVFNLLCFEMYDLAESMAKFGHELNNVSNDNYRRIFIINESLARKLNKKKKYLPHIDKEDWSATGDKFKIAVHLLREEWDDASEVMKKIGARGELTKSDYINWPIFKEFRETQQFRETYENVFKEAYSMEGDVVIDDAVESGS